MPLLTGKYQMRLRELTERWDPLEPALKAFASQTEQRLGLEQFSLSLNQIGDILLSLLVVPKGKRKVGIGTQAMEALCDFADKNERRIVLSPAEKDRHRGTTSHTRLIGFYRRFGFYRNRGKDYRIRETMIRQPVVLEDDFFQGSRTGNENHDWDVQSLYRFVEQHRGKYFVPRYPLENVKNQLDWWTDNYGHPFTRGMKRVQDADTSFPILIIMHIDPRTGEQSASVADGLNRLKKAIISGRKFLPAYVVPENHIKHLAEPLDSKPSLE